MPEGITSDLVDRPSMAIVSLIVLLRVRDRAAMDTAIFCGSEIDHSILCFGEIDT